MKVIKQAPTTYEHWIDSGRIIIPCLKGTPIVTDWSSPNFKVTKEEWRTKYTHCAIGLRLDQDIDFDIDNELAKRFIEKYVRPGAAISGRPSNPKSHYWWKGKLDFKKFSLPKELEGYYKAFPHGATLCEIRNGSSQYTIVPESLHSKANEHVKWESYEGIKEYPGDLNTDLRKVALSTALCIVYGSQGQRDAFCTAVAGVLVKHTKWTEEEINEFVHNLALLSDDNEAEDRAEKGTSVKKATKKYGMNKLAEIIGCSPKSVAEIFSWIGVGYETVQGAGVIGEILEYGEDRYLVQVNAMVEGKPQKIEIIVNGPTLMKQGHFYDEVMKQAQVWIPQMKKNDFDKIMKIKFDARSHSDDYVEEAAENNKFIKYFEHYLSARQASTDKKSLIEYKRPHYNQEKKVLEFDLDNFEDYLNEVRRIDMPRVDLVLKVQRVLEARKIRGKAEGKSFPRWRITDYEIAKSSLIIEGEAIEVKEIEDDKA
jgi:hypothetical protein|tara:strand:+ start:300 stop:1748 length:1449 start_codon:yes stop_codon:yes gene_type:complete